jgi:hypothetical protein
MYYYAIWVGFFPRRRLGPFIGVAPTRGPKVLIGALIGALIAVAIGDLF